MNDVLMIKKSLLFSYYKSGASLSINKLPNNEPNIYSSNHTKCTTIVFKHTTLLKIYQQKTFVSFGEKYCI
jgi:hypothetical protein